MTDSPTRAAAMEGVANAIAARLRLKPYRAAVPVLLELEGVAPDDVNVSRKMPHVGYLG